MIGMAMPANRHKEKPDGKRHAATYPWERWFRKKQFTLMHGQHFQCTLSGMTINIRQAARRHGVRVRIEQGWAELHVTVKGPEE